MSVSFLHPPLAAFPFALLCLVALLELACWLRPAMGLRPAVAFCLALAAVFAVGAFFSGYPASEAANQTFTVPDDIISRHHAMGRLLLFLIFPCLALQFVAQRVTHSPGTFRVFYLLCLLLCLGLVIYTGYLGGRLVFDYGAGVTAVLEVVSKMVER